LVLKENLLRRATVLALLVCRDPSPAGDEKLTMPGFITDLGSRARYVPPMFYGSWVFRILVTAFISVILSGCDLQPPSESESENRKTVRPFIQGGNSFVLSVQYQQQAEPYVGVTQGNIQIWSIVESNLRQILPSSITQISVPYTFSQMTPSRIGLRNVWTEDSLRALAFQTQFSSVGSGSNVLTVYYLRGIYQQNPLAMGLHFHGSPAIFVFKDVVVDLGGSQTLQHLAEQTVVLHEIGHALGLVNGYVEMASYPHEDPSSESHCSNPSCVMYKKNNGTTSLQTFLQQMSTSQSLNFFGQECLVDMQTFNRNNR